MSGKLTVKKNELIEKRRKKNFYKRSFLFILLLAAVLVTLCLKLSFFNVNNVEVINNKIVSTDEIKKISNIELGNNIFYLSFKKIKTNILSNPYISSVDIKRKLPGTVEISITERAAAFYGIEGNSYIIVDENGIVLEERKDIKDMKLIRLDGIDTKSAVVGKPLSVDDKRKLNVLKNLTELLNTNTSSVNITSVDISDMVDLKAYAGNMCIKLGEEDNLKDKLNKAFNIMQLKGLKDAKGYIDVSFNGIPVFFIDK